MGSTPLYDALRAFAAQRPLRMHMPGHKGKSLPAPELAAIARRAAEKLGWPGDKVRWWLGHTEEISRSLHVIPLYLERTAD